MTLQHFAKAPSGNDCIVTIPWTPGPTGKDTVQLLLADRPIARCEIHHVAPHALAYLAFDPDAVALRKFLLPQALPATPPAGWTKDQKDAGTRFETACGTLLGLLGFRVTPLAGLEMQGDWLVEHKVGDTIVQFLVEASVALKDQIDLKKLATNSRHLGEHQSRHVPGAVFTSVVSGSNLTFAGNAAGQEVRVLYRAELESLAALALDTTSEHRTNAAFRLITGLSLV